ncbi:hypothetical protein JB92DRAFT_3032701 [Gautieria morchelliformis]|nr:hypothetical protein JB92DRAFT_3032701 [Gautieria morchelliformis]
MSTNLPQPQDPSDDEGRVYFSTTPTQGPSAPPRNPMSRSASRSSAWSVDTPPHHHQGTSYYPSSSPPARPTSPIPRRIRSSSTRYRAFSGAERRSTSVSTGGKADNEDAAQRDASDEDEDLTPGPERDGNDADVTGLERDREFTEEDPLTLKDRQSLINVEHPFGLPIWKPALYKKSRTVTRDAETEVHSVPTAILDWHFIPGNVFWAVSFGWWIALVALVVSGVLSFVPFGGRRYAWLLLGLSWYILWPFGKYVEGDVEEGDDDKDDDEDEVGNGGPPEPDSSNRTTVRGQSPILESPHESESSAGVPFTSHSTISTITPTRAREHILQSSVERTPLIHTVTNKVYGAINPSDPIASMEVPSAEHWLGKAIFWLAFISLLAPILLVVTLVCWGFIITIPMAKLNWELLKLLWSRPLNIRFCAAPPPTVVPTQPPLAEQNAASDASEAVASYTIQRTRLSAGQVAPHLSGTPRSTVLLCTYRAIGLRYYKYTVGGVNIMFINLLPVVFFVIFDGFVLLPLAERREHAGMPLTGFLAFISSRALIFVSSLLSVIPLSYFIGMAVASISAQSSIGMGAVINATFGSIVEIILYAIALTQGKGRLVEGSLVGSILAGVLLLPGLSMCGGALRKKEQKFNAKSAGVTSTMLIMAIIGVLTPTMFYQVYGNFQLTCDGCPPPGTNTTNSPWTCTHCYYTHPDPMEDPFYQSTVKEFMYFCAGILLFSYLIGLWFSLRTHASQIWQNPQQLMHPLDFNAVNVPGSNRMSLYHRLAQPNLTGSLPIHRLHRKQSTTTMGSISGPISPTTLGPVLQSQQNQQATSSATAPHLQRPSSPTTTRRASNANLPGSQVPYPPVLESVDHAVKAHGLEAQPLPPNLTTDDFTRAVAVATVSALRHQQAHPTSPVRVRASGGGEHEEAGGHGHGGHDAPSWSRGLSASVLLACTFLYALIAEILVDVVDVVLEGSGIQEKFLGVTLFALVPNTTEFMNAISFAINGNIALSMEIGSAYALQVCLLQIPAMVAFSAWYQPTSAVDVTSASTFTLIFPRWDVIAIILSIFLLTYTYIEAKANYHRGSILILSYIVLGAGFYYAPPTADSVEMTAFAGATSGPSSSFVTAVWTYLFAR